MSQELVSELRRQNSLLKKAIGFGGLALIALLVLSGARSQPDRANFSEINVERINVINANGKPEIVISNRTKLPRAILDGKQLPGDRRMPGLIFYNEAGDESGGLVFDGKLDANGVPSSGMHFSMDRYGGDQMLALGHYENDGTMESGLNVYDRGLAKDYEPLFQAYQNSAEGPDRDVLRERWIQAGGKQTTRLFVGKTRGKSSAVVLADMNGNPRIMMLVTPEGKPTLNFLDDKGDVIQSLPDNNRR